MRCFLVAAAVSSSPSSGARFSSGLLLMGLSLHCRLVGCGGGVMSSSLSGNAQVGVRFILAAWSVRSAGIYIRRENDDHGVRL